MTVAGTGTEVGGEVSTPGLCRIPPVQRSPEGFPSAFSSMGRRALGLYLGTKTVCVPREHSGDRLPRPSNGSAIVGLSCPIFRQPAALDKGVGRWRLGSFPVPASAPQPHAPVVRTDCKALGNMGTSWSFGGNEDRTGDRLGSCRV